MTNKKLSTEELFLMDHVLLRSIVDVLISSNIINPNLLQKALDSRKQQITKILNKPDIILPK